MTGSNNFWAAVLGRGQGRSENTRRKHLLRGKAEKEQSAMEYLLTYGWAILIIAIVMGILFQIGAFNGLAFAPRAQPGSCQVVKTAAGEQLLGICSGLLPQFVGSLAGQTTGGGSGNGNGGAGGIACVNTTIPTMNLQTGGYNTVTFWMYWNGTLNESPVGYPGYFLWLSTNSCIGYSTGNKDAYGVSASGLASKWVMVAVEFYNGPYTLNSTLYINGAAQNLYQCLPTAHTGLAKGNLLIGSNTGSKYKFTGALANVQIYNTSLNAAEVQAIYDEGLGGAPVNLQNLVAWFPLNGNANDYSGNSQNLVVAKCAYSYLGSYSTPLP
ncbi:MAG: LamG domain-containing protein [Candidatus Marsarchaeota archaeon]|nr:LamG domain-containing protein [Candidatus Marsarchaeota archaeon]